MPRPGERVGAFKRADEKRIELYGYGVYDGHHEPPEGPVGFTKGTYEEAMLAAGCTDVPAYTNPRITLDNGKVLWGAQCWWLAEEHLKRLIGNREVVMVDVPE